MSLKVVFSNFDAVLTWILPDSEVTKIKTLMKYHFIFIQSHKSPSSCSIDGLGPLTFAFQNLLESYEALQTVGSTTS
jgi:hypothetical protein